MTILSMHHWHNREKVFAEIHDIDKTIFPTLSELEDAFRNMEVSVLNIPTNCADGFLAAYWQRPEAYLDELVREKISTFTKIANHKKGLDKLQNDIRSVYGSLKIVSY
jgi:hypothetical protein